MKSWYDDEHDSINYSVLFSWIIMAFIGGYIWYSIFTNGFFITLIWIIVISAILGLWLRVSGRG